MLLLSVNSGLTTGLFSIHKLFMFQKNIICFLLKNTSSHAWVLCVQAIEDAIRLTSLSQHLPTHDYKIHVVLFPLFVLQEPSTPPVVLGVSIQHVMNKIKQYNKAPFHFFPVLLQPSWREWGAARWRRDYMAVIGC